MIVTPAQKKRIVFFGSADFSLPSLIGLSKSRLYEIAAVVTQPDKPFGRGRKISQNPVKQWATENGYEILQPEKINTGAFTGDMTALEPDVFVVVAYGKIFPSFLLSIPKYGAINVHGSLLPKYRGASPVQAAILSGDAVTGATIMRMDNGLDTGPVLAQTDVAISSADTAGSLSEKISNAGALLLADTLIKFLSGEINSKPQPQNGVNITKKIKKNDGRINWSDPAAKIERQVRAFYPWPVAWTKSASDSHLIKIHHARLSEEDPRDRSPGTVFISQNNSFLVCCGDKKALEIIILQPENKNKMPASDYLQGHKELLISGLI